MKTKTKAEYKAIGKKSKNKGAAGERELASLLREYGFDTIRSRQHCGAAGDAADVLGLPGIHIECKRVEKLNLEKAMEQCTSDAKEGEMPVVFHRRNRTPWKVTLSLDDFMRLYLNQKQTKKTKRNNIPHNA